MEKEEILEKEKKSNREESVKRDTNETKVSVTLNLDGKGHSNIDTGIGFLDHMLILMTKHGRMDLDVVASGDLDVDSHHTIEDIGIVLGQCFKETIGDKVGIVRYGTAYVPMDEALAFVSLDISNRPFLVFNCELTVEYLGKMQSEMVEEFLRAFAFNAGITLHVNILYGKNNHHMVEAIFKALGQALNTASTIDESISGVMSTKGTI
jgi:imidazoleglycerol-phosphate dehydratase